MEPQPLVSEKYIDQKNIRVLLVEDNSDDAVIIGALLSTDDQNAFSIKHCVRLKDAIEYLNKGQSDVILLDIHLPDSHGLETFIKIKKESKKVPIIILTGLDDEKMAGNMVSKGAQDYLVKTDLTTRHLATSMRYAIQREKLLNELREAHTHIKELHGLLPICSYCKKIRNDKGYWQQIEEYVMQHTDADFSHGMCPDCIEKLYPGIL